MTFWYCLQCGCLLVVHGDASRPIACNECNGVTVPLGEHEHDAFTSTYRLGGIHAVEALWQEHPVRQLFVLSITVPDPQCWP